LRSLGVLSKRRRCALVVEASCARNEATGHLTALVTSIAKPFSHLQLLLVVGDNRGG
jgi:hypothetical protein